MHYDYAIVGGGIVGLATALQLQQRFPRHRIVVLEKESELGRHQSGRNSGVLHSGIYYPPGSFKARFCQAGAAAIKEYCARHAIPVNNLGKLIVATEAHELPALRQLLERGRAQEIHCRWLDGAELRERQPALRGRAAVRVDGTAMVDFGRVLQQFARDFEAQGGEVRRGCALRDVRENRGAVHLTTSGGEIDSRYMVACAGAQADRLARTMGLRDDFRIVPVRGEYYRLPEHRRTLVSEAIYPVPDPALPFLGVHITPMLDGRITVGPNAVLSRGRERESATAWRDLAESLDFPGFWRMGLRYWRFALREAYESRVKSAYLARVRRYCPDLQTSDLLPCPAGIRAQAVGRDGSLLQDFLFAESPRSLHVCNAPSPAATSAVPIGAYLCDKLRTSGRC